jgi:hypothetical protein
MGQLVRALQMEGPQTPMALEELVGARFWEGERFQSALAFAVADGLVVRTDDDLLAASG